jgi:rRNA-processing protein FCF1
MEVLQFDEEYQVLVDQQGLLVPSSNLVALAKQMQLHLSHSELELEAIARRTLEKSHPRMVGQFDMDYFK